MDACHVHVLGAGHTPACMCVFFSTKSHASTCPIIVELPTVLFGVAASPACCISNCLGVQNPADAYVPGWISVVCIYAHLTMICLLNQLKTSTFHQYHDTTKNAL